MGRTLSVRTLSVLITGVIASVRMAHATDDLHLKLLETIPLDGVDGRFDHFGMDVAAKRLYIAALGNNTLEAIDLGTGKRIQSIKGLREPSGIRVMPGTSKVVVSSSSDGKVCVFDSSLKLLGEVHDLNDADNVRLDPEGKLAYVGYGDGAISVIDPETMKKVGDVKLDGHPEAFQFEASGERIFVNIPSAKQIAVIDRKTMTVAAKWFVQEATSNFPMAVDGAQHRLFIGCRQPTKVLIVDTQTGKTIGNADCVGDTDDLFFDPTDKKLYVTGGGGAITVFQCDESNGLKQLYEVQTASGARTSLFVPETKRFTWPSRTGERSMLKSRFMMSPPDKSSPRSKTPLLHDHPVMVSD